MSALNDASTDELLRELLLRAKHTNGLEFCDTSALINLYHRLEVEIYEGDHAPQ